MLRLLQKCLMTVVLAGGVLVGMAQAPAAAAPAGRLDVQASAPAAQVQTVQYYYGGPPRAYGRPYYRPYPRHYARRYYAPPPRPYYGHHGRPHFRGRPYY